MGTTIEKLTKVLQTKEAIRTAINNKGGTLTESDTFSSYSTAIDNIQTGSGDNPMQEYVNNNGGDGKPSCEYLFSHYKGTSLDSVLNGLDTSNVADMSSMFYDCSKLTTIPQLDTSNVTNMANMFYYCSSLTTIPLLNTSKVTSMNSMFYSCSSLTTIPALDTSKVTNMSNTFKYCSSLKSISQWNTDKVTNMSAMFAGCNRLKKIDITKLVSGSSYNLEFASDCCSLKTLIIRTMDKIPSLGSTSFNNCYHFYGITDATYNPEGLKDGAIYVPDDKVEALKVATNWSTFADIIKPLSEYVEE